MTFSPFEPGRPATNSGRCDHPRNNPLSGIFYRELVLLLALGVITAGLFVFTRSMAARHRAMTADVAMAWYERGQQEFKDGKLADSIEAFRNAVTRDHDNARYVLALAGSLEASGREDEARLALLRLRLAAPEDGDINLQLARLSTHKAESLPEAVRYYHNALYGVWPGDQAPGQRRAIRTELISLLLNAGKRGQALSEILILGSDIDDDAESHDQVGNLFLAAGDLSRANQHFSRTLQLNQNDSVALRGVGHAAFNAGDYVKAQTYLEAAVARNETDSDSAALLEVVRLVQSSDPLAPRISSDERIRRLTADLKFSSEALKECRAQLSDNERTAALEKIEMELADDQRTRFRPASLRQEADGFRMGMNLVFRIETLTEQYCGAPSPMHRALLLIANRHGATEQ